MKAVFCTLILCFSIVGLTAQTFRGSIQGTVADSSKASVPGAQVTVMSPETGLKRTTITNYAGEYVVTELPLGAFDITVKKDGFRTQVLKGVRVEVAASQRVDVTLEPGAVSETVDVTAQSPLVESAENNMGGTLEATQFSELPVNGRDFTKLLVMVPGSGGDPSGAADSAGSFGLFSINGNRGRSNNYLIDGTDMNDGYRNLPAINQGGVFGTPATVLPIDALEQISVINSTEAEYGRSSGATVNIVTKSGTNAIHGSAYEYFRNSALDARNFFNPVGNPQNAFHNNQFGFSLGGPLVKNKTFWFASYEGDREAVGIPTVATVPSSAQLNQAIADNGGVVNPVIANLLARNPWSLPANGSGSLITSDRASNRADSVIAKIDQHIGESDLLTARYFYSNSDQSFPLALVNGGLLPGFNTVTPTNLNIASVSYTHVFTPAFLMETRFGYNRFAESFAPQDNAFNPNSIGLNTGTTAQDFGLPLITVKGFAPLGAAASSPRGRIDTNWQLLDNFSYSAGRHHWKFGYEYRRTNVHGFFDNGYRGSLTFNNLDDFIAGTPDSGRQAQGNSTRNTFQNNNSLYLQDSFRLFPRLTINYGVRWEYFGVIGETKNQFSILDSTGNLKQVNQLYPRDLNNFAPRASFAWDVFGNAKTVVRSGWGLYYDAFSQDFFVGQLPFNTFNSGPAYNGIGPNPITFSFSPTAVLQPGVSVFAPSTFGATDVFTVDQKLRTPYIQVYNLNIEQELAKNVALQVGYVGSAGRKLFRFLDLNQTNPATGTVAFPALGFVNQFQSSASSSYNSLQASLHLRDWHRLTSSVSYTWSHSIDNASDGQDYVPNASQPDNSFRPDLEKASSNFDLRHHFSWAYGYRFPDTQSMKLLTNGWGLDGVLTLNSGQPYNVNYLFEGNFNGSGEFFGRPDLVGNPFAGTHTPSNFLNLSAFQVPCTVDGSGNCIAGTQHFGNLGRNAFTGPAYKNLDFSLVKDTKINERVSLQFRVNAFNILNHPNFANPLWPSFAVDFLQNGQSANGRGVGFLPITTTPDVGVGNPFLGGGGSRNLELAMRVKF
ncbi:MAG TPA: carboxypeptidase regulatory-like domain-containing protein [Candidatus Angelobacter sp.]|nr:carboxypeptidase regulatory-like domain-containing protein [Candidatus Angelobacter sp.]